MRNPRSPERMAEEVVAAVVEPASTVARLVICLANAPSQRSQENPEDQGADLTVIATPGDSTQIRSYDGPQPQSSETSSLIL